MSTTSTLLRLFLRDYGRTAVNLLMLAVVPLVFVAVAAPALVESARLLGGSAKGLDMHIVTAGWAAGFVAALATYFQVAGHRSADRRLLTTGLAPRRMLSARIATALALATLSSIAALVALALTGDSSITGRTIAGTLGFALLYAAIGAIIGAFVSSPVNGAVLILFVWIIDVFFGPTLTSPDRKLSWPFPTHFLSLWMVGRPSGHGGGIGDLGWAAMWVVVACVTAALVLRASVLPAGRRRPRAGVGVRTVRVRPVPTQPSVTVSVKPRFEAMLMAHTRLWVRNRLLWLLLVLVPVVFVVLSDAITPPGAMAVRAVRHGAAVTEIVDPARIHAGTMAPSGIAALAALAGMFIMLETSGGDRLVALAGMGRAVPLLTRIVVLATAATLSALVTLAVALIFFSPGNPMVYALGLLLIAWLYAGVGLCIAPVFGKVAGVLLAFLLPFLDLGIGQSPMLRAEPVAWVHALPGYGAMRIVVDGALTPDFDETASLLQAVVWIVALLAVGVLAPMRGRAQLR